MTKTIVLGSAQQTIQQKPIEFFTCINIIDCDNVEVETVSNQPHEWDYIECIIKNYAPKLDLMFAYDDDNRGCGRLFIGRWNDGVVK
jgi:hypothetical protein